MVLQTQGDNEQALALYEKILQQQPNELTSLNNAAWLYMPTDPDRAEAFAKKAYEQAPDNAPIVDTYGWILFKQGKIKEAKQALQRAYQLMPDNAEIKTHWLEVKDL